MRSVGTVGRLFAAATTIALLGACVEKGSDAPVAPVLPSSPAIPAQYRGAAFIMDISATRNTVKITAPSSSINSRLNPNVLGGDAQFSLLGGDAIELIAIGFQKGALGAVAPNKILVTFSLQILNKLTSFQLTTPSFPTPPSGVTGVQAFPFEISVTTAAGSVTSAGNEFIVSTPRGGVVEPSADWGEPPLGDGNHHNFFNDIGCVAMSNDCFRYEPFAPIGPLQTTAFQRVGFLIDPTVGDFRAKLIVAADLVPAQPAGNITGTVTRLEDGTPLPGVSVVVTPVGGSPLAAVFTAADGSFNRLGVPTIPNAGAINLPGLRIGCVNPGPYAYSGVTTAGLVRDIVVSCPLRYQVTGTWGPITPTGPTGRQVALTVAIDMGSAPGNPSVNGAAADELVGIAFRVKYDSLRLAFDSRTLLSPSEFDIGVFSNLPFPDASGSKMTTIALASSLALTKPGTFQIVRFTFNLRPIVSGATLPTLSVLELIVRGAPGFTSYNVRSNTLVNPLPALIIP